MKHFSTCVFLFSVCLGISACGDGNRTPSSPSPTATPAPTPTPALSLAGTWTGTLTQPERSTKPIPVKSWTATQSGTTVSGPVVLDVNTGNTQATLTGTVSGAQLTSATFSVPFQDGFPTGCSFSGTGTLAATASSISGSLAMTFPAACVGPENVSNTATATWTFSLAK